MHLIAFLPPLLPGELERWLLAAAAVGSLVIIWRKLFGNGNTPVRRCDLEALQKKVSLMHRELLTRLADLEATLARLDERTKRP